MRLAKRNCPICGCKINNSIFSVHMKLPKELRLPDSYHVAECDYCGFCYADTEADAEDYRYYYENNNFYGGLDIEISAYGPLFQETKALLDSLGISGEKLLDIGFGKGELDIFLSRNGYPYIEGLDPSWQSVNHLKSYGVEARCGSVYDEAAEGKGEYKCLFMYGMIEHLYDPFLAVSRAKAYLKEGGYLFWWLPVFDDMREDDTPIVNNFNQEHINYFSSVSVRNLASMSGLRLIRESRLTAAQRGSSKAYGILSVYQPDDDVVCELSKDRITRSSIEEYHERVGGKESAVRRQIAEWKRTQEEILVWGTGAYMMNLAAETELLDCNIAAFVDNNPAKQGGEISGIPVAGPELLQTHTGRVAICSMMYADCIRRQIREAGYENEMIIL